LVVCSAQQENDKFHQTAMKVMEKRCNEWKIKCAHLFDSSRRAISLNAVVFLTVDICGACIHGPEWGHRVKYHKCRSYNCLWCLSHRLVGTNTVREQGSEVSECQKMQGVGIGQESSIKWRC
jgi:hypothetical protein